MKDFEKLNFYCYFVVMPLLINCKNTSQDIAGVKPSNGSLFDSGILNRGLTTPQPSLLISSNIKQKWRALIKPININPSNLLTKSRNVRQPHNGQVILKLFLS